MFVKIECSRFSTKRNPKRLSSTCGPCHVPRHPSIKTTPLNHYIFNSPPKMRLLHLYSLSLSICSTVLAADQLGISVQYAPLTCDRKSAVGDTLSMHYVGELGDGSRKQFDSSFERNKPFSFTLGRGEVIKGWDQGLVGMCVGERRRLTIPSELGYGAGGTNGIPGGSVLIFETALLSIR